MSAEPWVRWFDDIGLNGVPAVGGKTASPFCRRVTEANAVIEPMAT